MNMACVLYSFNRPKYLDATLTSLEQNTLAKKVPWYFFQDGAITPSGRQVADHQKINECLTRLNKSPLKGLIYNHGENVGITWQFKKAFELFDFYDNLLIFEDDMVVSPHYIELILNIAKQWPKAIIGAGWSRWAERFPDAPLNAVVRGRTQLWGYWFPRDLYTFVRPTFDKFVSIVGKDHVGRPKELIKQTFNCDNAAVDNLVGRTLWEAGYDRITTVWPRGKYIGQHGLHMNPEKYKTKGFADRQYVWPGDPPSTFELIFEAKR